MGDGKLGSVADHCHMNCYRYLVSSWIYYTSKLITQFLLTYKESVGLVLGIYCDNNAICYSYVAKELLDGTNNIAMVVTLNFGLTIRKLMTKKKKEIKERFGKHFTFLQRFQHLVALK
jgi:hypothetical protein